MADNTDDLVISISTDQATLRRSIQRIERDIAGLAGGVQKQFASVGKAIDSSITTQMQNRINAMVGVGTGAAKEWSGALADQGKELERLRAKYSPLFATINQYKQTIADVRRAHALGALGPAEYAAAMSKERTAALASIAAIKARNAALSDVPAQQMLSGAIDRDGQFRRQNLGYQLFDIGQGVAGGMPLPMILAQQGPQIAQLYAGQGGLKAALKDTAVMAGGLVSALSPVGIAVGGVTAAAAAFYFLTRKEAKTTDQVLQEHAANIKALSEAYSIAEDGAKSYSKADKAIAEAAARKSGTDVLEKQKQAIEDLNNTFSQIGVGGRGGAAVRQMIGGYTEFAKAFQDLQKTGDVEKFAASIEQIGKEKGFATQADNILETTKNLKLLNDEAVKNARIMAMIKGASERGFIATDPGAQRDYQQAQTEDFLRRDAIATTTRDAKAQFNAQLQSTMARSPIDRMNAARAAQTAIVNPGEDPEVRAQRIELAGTQALISAQHDLRLAKEDRIRASDAALKQAQFELTLIGKTVEEQEKLRASYQATAAIKEAAARNNVKADPKELADAARTSAQIAAINHQVSSAKANTDLLKNADDRLGSMKLEIDLLGKYGVEAETARFKLELLQQAEDKGRSLSPQQRQELEAKVALYKEYADTLSKVKLQQDLAEERRVSLLSPQEQQITAKLKEYGRPTDDLNSAEANAIRQSLNYAEVKDGVKTFMSTFQQALVANGGNVGDALGQAILNALNNQMQKSLDAIFDKLASGVASAVFGSNTGAPVATTAASTAIAAVNDNTAALVTKAAPTLNAAGMVNVAPVAASAAASTTDVAAYIRQAAIQRGIDPNVALKVAQSEGGLSSWNRQSDFVKNGVREQSYGPYQLYMNGGLGNEFQRTTGMNPANASSGPAGVDFALDHAQKNGWSSWYGAKNTGIGKWDGIGTAPAVDVTTTAAVNSNLTKLSGNLSSASKEVGTFGTGLGDMGKNLSTAFPAAPAASGASGGGLFSLLFGAFKPNGAQATAAFNGSLSPGLFASGGHVFGLGGPTDDKIPAMLSNGEFVTNAAMTKKHRNLLEAINSGRIAHLASGGMVTPSLIPMPVAPSLMAAAHNDNSAGSIADVRVYVDENGNWQAKVEGISRRTARAESVSQMKGYQDNQRRGGFSGDQRAYAARKG